jgi:histidinol phosphatase-like PHP family hydrolase
VIYDFHTHTLLSDGALSPIELINRAQAIGYRAIAIADHVGVGSLARLIEEIARDCALARDQWDILAIPGIELTHLPAEKIAETARQAKELGAWLVIVHGQTPTEPVPQNTNLTAVGCPQVDILAHPGLLSLEEAKLAAANNVFIEITTRKGHSLTNGHVALVARQAGARLLLNSDAHEEADLLTAQLAATAAQGAGLDEAQCHQLLRTNPRHLLQQVPQCAQYLPRLPA